MDRCAFAGLIVVFLVAALGLMPSSADAQAFADMEAPIIRLDIRGDNEIVHTGRWSSLSDASRATVLRGDFTVGDFVAGFLLNWVCPLGLGQAIQGRWLETGWIVALGEVASVALGFAVVGITYAVTPAPPTSQISEWDGRFFPGLIVGLLGGCAFYIYALIDAVDGPASHNARRGNLLRNLRVAPTASPIDGSLNGGTIGFAFPL